MKKKKRILVIEYPYKNNLHNTYIISQLSKSGAFKTDLRYKIFKQFKPMPKFYLDQKGQCIEGTGGLHWGHRCLI